MTTAVAAFLGVWLLLMTVAPLSAQGEYERLLEDIEREIATTVEKPYSLSGFLEFQPILFGLDRDAAFYRLNFFDRDEGDLLDQYNFRLRPEGSLSALRPEGSISGLRPEGSHSGLRLEGSHSSLHAEPSVSGLIPVSPRRVDCNG